MSLISRFLPIVSAICISVFCGGSTHAEPAKETPEPSFALCAPFIDHAVPAARDATADMGHGTEGHVGYGGVRRSNQDGGG